MNNAAAARAATHEEIRQLLRHRVTGAAMLKGHGLEIGALHYPLEVPRAHAIDLLDVDDAAMLRRLFPELADEAIPEPRWTGDVVSASVPEITGRRFDFIVMNHVLEHVANPIQVIANTWAGLVEGGFLVLSVPDKRFTYDNLRPLTTFKHLLAEFHLQTKGVDASHYIDFLEGTSPEVFEDRSRLLAALERATLRREHAHVWDCASFHDFLQRTVQLLGLRARTVYESTAASNNFEYFAVVQRALG